MSDWLKSAYQDKTHIEGGTLCPWCDHMYDSYCPNCELESQTYWVIANIDESLFWSNQDGWVDLGSATRFSTDDRYSLRLPIAGSWVYKEGS